MGNLKGQHVSFFKNHSILLKDKTTENELNSMEESKEKIHLPLNDYPKELLVVLLEYAHENKLSLKEAITQLLTTSLKDRKKLQEVQEQFKNCKGDF
jgi:hypothetical protein